MHSCAGSRQANPRFDEKINAQQQHLRSSGVHARLFASTAFSTQSFGETFYVESHRYRTGVAYSSTLRGSMPLPYDRTSSAAERYVPTRVSSVNASEFLLGIVEQEPASEVVAIKIDIGAPFGLDPPTSAAPLVCVSCVRHLTRAFNGSRLRDSPPQRASSTRC